MVRGGWKIAPHQQQHINHNWKPLLEWNAEDYEYLSKAYNGRQNTLQCFHRSVAAFNTDVELLQSYLEVDGQRRMENSTMHQWQHIDHDESQMLKFMRTPAKSLWSPRFCSTMLSCESLSSWNLFSLLFLILFHIYDLPIHKFVLVPFLQQQRMNKEFLPVKCVYLLQTIVWVLCRDQLQISTQLC